MEVIAGDIEGRHLGIADLDALGIGCRVEFAGDGEAGVSRSRSDQFDDRQVAGQGSCPPVLRNVGKEAVLDAVPLGCPWRVMAHAKRQAGFIGEFLQFQLPQPDPRPVGTTAVGGVVSRRRAGVVLCERWRQTLRGRLAGGGFKLP